MDSSKYKSVRQAVQLIFQEEGISFISRGWAATAVGYALQGFAKFAAYEALKAALIAGLGVVIINFDIKLAKCIFFIRTLQNFGKSAVMTS